MKITESIIRVIAITVAFGLALWFVFGEETDGNGTAFILHFLFDKAFGLLCGAVAVAMVKAWSGDRLVSAMTKRGGEPQTQNRQGL